MIEREIRSFEDLSNILQQVSGIGKCSLTLTFFQEVYSLISRNQIEFLKKMSQIKKRTQTLQVKLKYNIGDNVELFEAFDESIIELCMTKQYTFPEKHKMFIKNFKNLQSLSFNKFQLRDIIDILPVLQGLDQLKKIDLLNVEIPDYFSQYDVMADVLDKAIDLVKNNESIKELSIKNISDFLNKQSSQKWVRCKTKQTELQEQINCNVKLSIKGLEKLFEQLNQIEQEIKDFQKRVQTDGEFANDKNRFISLAYNKAISSQKNIKVEFDNMVEFLKDKNVIEANYYLAKTVVFEEPDKAESLLTQIPETSDYYQKAQYDLSNILLSKIEGPLFNEEYNYLRSQIFNCFLSCTGDGRMEIANVLYENYYRQFSYKVIQYNPFTEINVSLPKDQQLLQLIDNLHKGEAAGNMSTAYMPLYSLDAEDRARETTVISNSSSISNNDVVNELKTITKRPKIE
jgi:hypothetical protein